jgi:sulfonate transport system permease protein
MRRWLAQLAPGVVVLALLLWGIEEAVNYGLVKRSLMPAPSDIGLVLWDLFADGEVAGPLSETLARLGIGFAIGAALAIVMGLAMGYWPRLYALFEPLWSSCCGRSRRRHWCRRWCCFSVWTMR